MDGDIVVIEPFWKKMKERVRNGRQRGFQRGENT